MTYSRKFYWTDRWSSAGIIYGGGWQQINDGHPVAMFVSYRDKTYRYGVLGHDLFETEAGARRRVEELRAERAAALERRATRIRTLEVAVVTEGGEA